MLRKIYPSLRLYNQHDEAEDGLEAGFNHISPSLLPRKHVQSTALIPEGTMLGHEALSE